MYAELWVGHEWISLHLRSNMFNKDYYVVLFAGCSIGTLSGQPDSHATVIGRETEHCSSNSVVLFDLISCLCR